MKADTKGYTIQFHLYEIIRIGIPIKTKSRLVMVKNLGKGEMGSDHLVKAGAILG